MRCKHFFFKTFVCVMALFILMSAVSAGVVFADEVADTENLTTDDGFEYSVADGEVTIVAYNGNYTDLVIPEEIDGMPVTTIGNVAFYIRTFDGVNYDKTPYKSVFVPKTVTSMPRMPFSSFDFLEKITVDEDNPVYDSRSGCNAIIETATNTLIAGCKNTIIPDGIEVIDYGAFSYCIGLESINLPDSIEYIGEYAFYECAELKAAKIREGVEVIATAAFYGCSSIKEIVVPESILEIWEYAFYECDSLEKLTFKGWVNTDEVPLVNGELKELAFHGYLSVLGNSFNECVIDTIILPKSLESIGENSFPNIGSVKNVKYEGSKKDWEKIEIGRYNNGLQKAKFTYNYNAENKADDSVVENGERTRGGGVDDGTVLIIIGAFVALIVIVVIVAVATSKKKARKTAQNDGTIPKEVNKD